jgi:hypothetical protein
MEQYNSKLLRERLDNTIQQIRSAISWWLMDTNEQVHVHCNITIDGDNPCGLSELEKPSVTEIWQHPTEGIITLKIEGYDGEMDLDELTYQDQITILEWLENNIER